jgi:uncharacterized protein with PhoU and TrkA domain
MARSLAGRDAGLYVAEARVKEGSKSIGQMVRDLYPRPTTMMCRSSGLVRRGKRCRASRAPREVRKGDFLVLEGRPEADRGLHGRGRTGFRRLGKTWRPARRKSLSLVEAIVPDGARIVGRSTAGLRLLSRHGVTLLGVSREGKRFRERVRKLTIKPGDVLLLLGPTTASTQVAILARRAAAR